MEHIEERNLKFWGHNCFSIEHERTILIIDPWFSKSGAFFGSWFQYPKNHHLQDKINEMINNYENSFIFISHEHQDHYDKSFLDGVNKNTTILIPSYRDKTFKKDFESLDLNVIEIQDIQKFNLSDNFWIKPYTSHIGINHDSAILISTKDFNFFNQNDCKIFDRLPEIDVDIDYYSVQFSGATWHPSNFFMTDEQKKEISHKKVNNKLNSVLNGINILRPKYFIPAAGPAIFPYLDESLSYGKDNIFIHQDQLNKYLQDNNIYNNIYLKPGDYLSSEKSNPIIPPTTIEEINNYKIDTIDIWENLNIKFDRKLLEDVIIKRLDKINDIDIIDVPVLILNYSNTHNNKDYDNDKKIIIDISNKTLLHKFKYDSPYEEIIADEKYFALMQSGERWQNIYLSLRARVLRKPDIFSNDLNIFLFSDIENIRENFILTKNISSERIMIKNDDGEIYEINRYCPHNGADLCKAKINSDNYLICPRHGWRFDLNNDGVDKLSKTSIKSKKIS